MPLKQIKQWLANESQLNQGSPYRMILATSTLDNFSHSRIVAIREISDDDILFFIQKGSRKTIEMQSNPKISATIWLANQQKQIILEGVAQQLKAKENQLYWDRLPKERQLRFAVYAPTSGQPILSLELLKQKLTRLEEQYKNHPLPVSEFYLGYRLIPHTIYFYTLKDQEFSHSVKLIKSNSNWNEQLLSP